MNLKVVKRYLHKPGLIIPELQVKSNSKRWLAGLYFEEAYKK